MLVALGDTHGDRTHRLDGETRTAVHQADHVCHTGDFTTEAVYAAMADAAGAGHGGAPLSAVYGNSDRPALQSRLPAVETVAFEGIHILITHGHRHDPTALSLLARQEEADVVLVGHTHRPRIEATPHCLIVNPGSHADPRGGTPAHAEIRRGKGSITVSLRTPAGALVDEESRSELGS